MLPRFRKTSAAATAKTGNNTANCQNASVNRCRSIAARYSSKAGSRCRPISSSALSFSNASPCFRSSIPATACPNSWYRV